MCNISGDSQSKESIENHIAITVSNTSEIKFHKLSEIGIGRLLTSHSIGCCIKDCQWHNCDLENLLIGWPQWNDMSAEKRKCSSPAATGMLNWQWSDFKANTGSSWLRSSPIRRDWNLCINWEEGCSQINMTHICKRICFFVFFYPSTIPVPEEYCHCLRHLSVHLSVHEFPGHCSETIHDNCFIFSGQVNRTWNMCTVVLIWPFDPWPWYYDLYLENHVWTK